MRRYLGQKLIVFTLLLLPTILFAQNEFVINYFERFDALDADFVQTITSKNHKEISSGELRIQKRTAGQIMPKFSFDYVQPFEQKLISNGNRLWHYDVDLMQVVIKPMTEINNNPLLVILLGDKSLDHYFSIRRQGRSNYFLTPKTTQPVDFKSIVVRFKGNVLSSFSATDVTGQEITIELKNIRQNPIFDSAAFEFKAPRGVDVIDETR